MYRGNKRLGWFGIGNKGGISRNTFRNKGLNRLVRLEKTKTYKVEKSKEPEDEKKYVVTYISETQHGYGEGIVFKGTFKECQKLKDELLRRLKYEQN